MSLSVRRVSNIGTFFADGRYVVPSAKRPHLRSTGLTSEGGVEIAWKVFAGEIGDTLALIVYQRAHQDGIGEEPEAVAQYVRAHLERGLGYLASEREIKEIGSFLGRWLNNTRADSI